MENELRAASRFFKCELAHWRRCYESGEQICQTKIYLIGVTQSHQRLLSFLCRQRCALTDLSEIQERRPDFENLDTLIASVGAQAEAHGVQRVCDRCSSAVGTELTKVTDIKAQILGRAKLSVNKHLSEANRREQERAKQDLENTLQPKELQTTKELNHEREK